MWVEARAGGRPYRGGLVDVLRSEASGLEDCVAAQDPTEEQTAAVRAAGQGSVAIQCQFAVILPTADSAIHRFAIRDLTSVRPLVKEAQSRLNAALDAVACKGTR